MGVKPEEIMLVTFTNKAANEIQQRIAKVTPDFYKMWIGTFHRNCTRILRMFGKYLNINNFSIIDTKDARNIIKKHMAACGEDTSLPNIKYYQTKISELKNNLIGKEQARNDVTINGNLAEIYAGYVDECWKHKTFDFDDLITYTILLLSSFKPVSDWVHNHIKYIMVDECLTGDTYVMTKNGKIKIKNLYNMYRNGNKTPLIKSFNLTTESYEFKPMTYAHKSSNREVFEIKTEGLNKLRCTDNHKVLTQRGYVEVKDLIINKDMLLLSDTDKQKTKLILNNDQYQIMLGSYLGDGHLDKRSDFNTYRLKFTQGMKQEKYFLSKIDAFGLQYTIEKSGYTNKENVLQSKYTRTFIINNDIFNSVINDIDELGLAIWYQDDGSLVNNRVRLYSETFTYEENILLKNMLLNRFNIDCEINKEKNCYYYLQLNKENSDIFLKLVSKYMHPSMQYKTNIDISNNIVSYDSKYKSYGGNRIVSIAPIGSEDVYDITVQDNHNFLASTSFYSTNIIVHNCQDTNSAQFVLIKLLIGNNNAMLVGDVSQSIYGFRNARPEYLENFADTTPNTLKLKLEQNYRSTKNIIEAANNVVVHNNFGTKLEMFCANEEGEKIGTFRATDSYSESRWVVSEIMTRQKFLNQKYSDFAIIYRVNFQSRLYEEELAKAGVPYVVFGSGSFYSRKEVKDLLAYCKLVINPMDTESFRRVLSTLRGVGKKTIENLIEYANNNKINFHMAIEDYVSNHNTVVASNLQQVLDVINKKYTKCVDIVDNVFTETDYRTRVAIVGTDEARDSIEIMDEFRSMIESVEKRNKDKSVSLLEMLDEISLLTDAKGDSKANSNAVKLMTAHASKGLEFNTVFVVGAEEGLFPHANAIAMNSIPAIEEERRLFYVAMTRAEKKLYITSCKQKKSNAFSFSPVDESRFVSEIPAEYKETCF